MWRCPVCGKEHAKGFACDQCDFVLGTDYEQYRTLSPYLPEDAKPVSVRRAEWNQSHASAPRPEVNSVYEPETTAKVNPPQTAEPASDSDATREEPPAKAKKPPLTPADDQQDDRHIATKKRFVSLLFWFFFGFFGACHFYEKSYFRGIFHLGLMGFFGYAYGSGAFGTEITILMAAVILLLWIIDFFRVLSRPAKYVI